MDMNMEDIEVGQFLPKDLQGLELTTDRAANKAKVVEALKAYDAEFAEKVKQAKENDQVLRYVGEIDIAAKTAKVEMQAVDRSSPLFRLKAGENLVSYYSDRYDPNPLILKGASANVELSASGIFADLLRLGRSL